MPEPIDIRTDDPRMRGLLRELEGLVTDAGGYLHPALQIVSVNGQISVETTAAVDEILVRLSESCLLPIDDVNFALQGDELAVASYPPDYGDARKAMLECMLAIYNRGRKIPQHRADLPWIAFADQPELLHQLHAGRLDAPKPTRFFELAKNADPDALTLESFFGTRTLRVALGDTAARRVVMPFLDFFNHHSNSPSFQNQDGDLAVACSRPEPDSNECYVRYNVMDAMDTYLNYGFVDRSAAFLRSVAARIELEGIGTIGIRSRVALPRKQPLPQGLRGLGIYLPRFQRTAEKTLVAAQMLIPTRALHQRLGGAFGAMIQNLAPGLPQDRLLTALESAAEQLLRANERYYADLQIMVEALGDRLSASGAREQLNSLIAFQRTLLAGQRNALSINPDALSGAVR